MRRENLRCSPVSIGLCAYERAHPTAFLLSAVRCACRFVNSGTWMCMSWSTVSLAGVYIARYCRKYSWWLDWHIRLQSIGTMGTIGFAAVASSMVHHQFNGWHQICGGIFAVLILLQASGGNFIHLARLKQEESRLHHIIRTAHTTIGRMSLPAAA